MIPKNQYGPQPVSAKIEGLTPGGTYHFRVAALNAEEIKASYGADMAVTMTGVYISGSGTEASPTWIESTSHNGYANARIDSAKPFTLVSMSGMKITCTAASLGTELFAPWNPRIGYFAGSTISGCDQGATVAMNGCYYSSEIANTPAPYTGTVSKSSAPPNRLKSTCRQSAA